jgi:hypothetical protein
VKNRRADLIRNAAGVITEDRCESYSFNPGVQLARGYNHQPHRSLMLTFRDDESDTESAPAKRDGHVVAGALLFVHEP